MAISLSVNSKTRQLDVESDTPLRYVARVKAALAKA
jgi:aerobic-type carbon monoxide dehydrogenase small subunit (CoxS/CutS family)